MTQPYRRPDFNSITRRAGGPISLNAEGEDFPVLKTKANEDVEVKESVFLCRWGASQNKPFCDWAHGEQVWDDSQ